MHCKLCDCTDHPNYIQLTRIKTIHTSTYWHVDISIENTIKYHNLIELNQYRCAFNSVTIKTLTKKQCGCCTFEAMFTSTLRKMQLIFLAIYTISTSLIKIQYNLKCSSISILYAFHCNQRWGVAQQLFNKLIYASMH